MWTENFQMYKLDLEKAEETNCQHLLDHRKCKGIPKKTSTYASLPMLKPLTVWMTTDWKILQEMGLPDHLTCFLRKLYAGQEATIRTGHGKMHWFVTGKEVHWGWILLPTYLNSMQSVYVSPSAVSNSLRPHGLQPTKLEYIMQNAKLDEA